VKAIVVKLKNMNPTHSINEIPEQIRGESLIRVSGLDHDVNGTAGAAPKPGDGAASGPFFNADDDELAKWIKSGGNIGVASQGDLVLIDIDDIEEWNSRVDVDLVDTFTVRSGGGGRHLYYRCEEWGDGASLRKDNEEIFSIRAQNSFVVAPPSIHHTTGEQYIVEKDEPIQTIHSAALNRLYEIANPSEKQPEQGGSGGGSSGDGGPAPRCSGCSVPNEYPNRTISIGELKSWVDGNDLPDQYNWDHKGQGTNDDESAADYILCKCMAESGASVESIKATMDKHRIDGSKWHRRGEEYHNYTIENAIQKAVEDTYVDFSDTADMGPNGSERRKTEEFGGSRTLQGGEQTMSQSDSEYSRIETVTAVESDDPEEGDNVVRAMIAQIVDTEDTYQFAQVLGGTIETDETFGPSPNWQTDQNGQDKTRTIGSADPDYLRLVGDALNELADKIEDSEVDVNADAEAAEVEADD
jgi:hypothetical protein